MQWVRERYAEVGEGAILFIIIVVVGSSGIDEGWEGKIGVE